MARLTFRPTTWPLVGCTYTSRPPSCNQINQVAAVVDQPLVILLDEIPVTRDHFRIANPTYACGFPHRHVCAPRKTFIAFFKVKL